MKTVYPLLENAFNSKDISLGISVVKKKQLTMSKITKNFEKQFSKYVGSKYAVMVNSGSSANLLSVFAAKNFMKPRHKANLIISFVMKKKIGNAVKRNKIRRKLKAIVQKLTKKKGAINKDYTYIVFGKSNAYTQKHDVLLPSMEKGFSKLKK